MYKFLSILFIFISLSSCNKNKTILMSEDSVFGDRILYGVVLDTYVHIYKEINNTSSSKDILRHGDFVYITNVKHLKTEDGNIKVFYFINTNSYLQGWVDAKSIEPFKYEKIARLRQKSLDEDISKQ